LKENCNAIFQLLRVKAIGKDDGRSRQRFGVSIDEKSQVASSCVVEVSGFTKEFRAGLSTDVD
jgi:hypothetical protein